MAGKIRSFANDVWLAVLLMLIVVIASSGAWRLMVSREDNLLIQTQLNRRLPEVRPFGLKFGDIIVSLRDVHGCDINVDWTELATAGVTEATPVHGGYRSIRVSKLLANLLPEVGMSRDAVTYYTSRDSIIITSRKAFEKRAESRRYDLRIIAINDFNCFRTNNPAPRKLKLTDPGVMELIQSLIQDTVDSASWIDNGGRVGRMRFCNGFLDVWQVPENHHQIRNVLESLYETHAISPCQLTELLAEHVGADGL